MSIPPDRLKIILEEETQKVFSPGVDFSEMALSPFLVLTRIAQRIEKEYGEDEARGFRKTVAENIQKSATTERKPIGAEPASEVAKRAKAYFAKLREETSKR